MSVGFVPPGCVEHPDGRDHWKMPDHVPWHREWMSMDGKVAIGLNEDGTVDEVLLGDEGGADLHIEQMDDQHYWMRVGKLHFWFSYEKGRRIALRVTDAEVEW